MTFTLLRSDSHSGADIVTLSDLALNDNSKVLTLDDVDAESPGRYAYIELLAIRIELTTTATGGNRMLSVRLEAIPSSTVLYEVAVGNNSLAASQSRTWQLALAVNETMVPVQTIQVRLPPRLYVNADQRLVIEDSAGIDAQDDMVVHVMSRLFDVRSL